MWRLEAAPRYDLPDVADFVETLNGQGDFFDRGAPIVVARAPGRLDLMGGIADYSGALVLELPLAAATFVAAQLADEPSITIRSLAAPSIDADLEVAVPLAALAPDGRPVDYAAARS